MGRWGLPSLQRQGGKLVLEGLDVTRLKAPRRGSASAGPVACLSAPLLTRACSRASSGGAPDLTALMFVEVPLVNTCKPPQPSSPADRPVPEPMLQPTAGMATLL